MRARRARLLNAANPWTLAAGLLLMAVTGLLVWGATWALIQLLLH